MRKGNGQLLCRSCLEGVEYSNLRSRTLHYSSADGPAVEKREVTVSHCPKDGHYSTVLDADMILYKQYPIDEIRLVLEAKGDYCLASKRTRSYWRVWFRRIWKQLLHKIYLFLGRVISKDEIEQALIAFCKNLKDQWLRYTLDLFSVNFDKLCTFIVIVSPIMGSGNEILHKKQLDSGVQAHFGKKKPP